MADCVSVSWGPAFQLRGEKKNLWALCPPNTFFFISNAEGYLYQRDFLEDGINQSYRIVPRYNFFKGDHTPGMFHTWCFKRLIWESALFYPVKVLSSSIPCIWKNICLRLQLALPGVQSGPHTFNWHHCFRDQIGILFS